LLRARELKNVLHTAGYRSETVSSLLGVRDILDIQIGREDYYDRFVLPKSDLADLTRFFLLNQPLSSKQAERLFEKNTARFLLESGLAFTDDEKFLPAVTIFPVDNLLITTDSWNSNKTWGEHSRFVDRVMYVGRDSIGLVRSVSPKKCRRTLDLCCGSGVQSLFAARHSQEVMAVDINPRAIRFAKFNAALNDIRNVEFHEGDLYQTLSEQSFNAIVANPPFVPNFSDSPKLLYRDAGPLGDEVLQQIVSGASEHLTRNGRLSVVADFINLSELQSRFEMWMRDFSYNCLVLIENEYSLLDYALAHFTFLDSEKERFSFALDYFEQLRNTGVQTIHFGYLFLQLKSEGRSFRIRPLASPIDDQARRRVSNYFDNRALIESGRCLKMRMELSDEFPGWKTAWGEKKYKVQMPGRLNSLDYDDPQTFRFLERVAKQKPHKRIVIDRENLPLVIDLALEGLIRFR
jgi:carbamoyltransferase